MKKVGIIGGAGGLGATMGFCLGSMGLFDEIRLIDIKENLAKSHAMDMDQSLSEISGALVRAGDWADLAGCGLVIMTAAVPAVKVASRNEFLEVNLKIVRAAAEEIKKYCPEAVVLTATAPIDVYNYVFHKIIGGDKQRFIGFCRNDSLRLRWAVGRVLGVDVRRVGGFVLGEHGETQVPIYSTVTVDNNPIGLSDEEIARVEALIKNWFRDFQALDSGRTSSWTSSTSISQVIKAIVEGSDKPVPGSAILDGEYGQSGVSFGVPLIYGPKGWEKVLEIELSPTEKEALAKSADLIRSLIEQCEL